MTSDLRYDCLVLDTMQIYGSDAETAAKLRSGEGGRLKGNAEKGEDALMPFDDARQCPDMTTEDEGALEVSQNRSIASQMSITKEAGLMSTPLRLVE